MPPPVQEERPITVMSYDPAIRSYFERHPSISSPTGPQNEKNATANTSPLHNILASVNADNDDDENVDDEDDDDEEAYFDDFEDLDDPFRDEAVADPNNPYNVALQAAEQQGSKNILKESRLINDVDFSRMNLEEYSPEQIEAIYKAKHLGSNNPHALPISQESVGGINPNSYPTAMTVTIERVEIANRPLDRPILYRVVFRGKKLKPIGDEANENQPQRRLAHQMVYESALTYHSLLFDTIKIDVHDLPKSSLLPYSHIGRARIRLSELESVNGSVVQSFPLFAKKAGTTKGRRMGNATAVGHIVVSFDFTRSVEDDEDDSILPDDSASLIGDLGDEELGSRFGTRMKTAAQGEAVVEEFMGYFRAVEKADSSFLDGDTISQAGSSFPSLAPSQTMAGTVLRFEPKKKGAIVGHRTLTGIQELSNIAAAFFNHGWPITKVEFSRSLLFIGKWQARHQAQHRTHDAVVDARKIRVATYFLRYTVATYGTVVMNFLGAGKGYVRDTLRPKADKKTAVDYLGIPAEDMLLWEFSGVEAFKPKFFVSWDSKTAAIVISVRGTLNIHEVVTDICAEYEPYKTGFAHRGMLRCALWLEQHLVPQLIGLIRTHRARALYIVGHSLGGSIAALLTMLIKDSPVVVQELRAASGCADPAKFRMHCFAFAPPPCVSGGLADSLEGWVDSYVNENDTVPRLSYGAVCDFRELVIKGAELLKTPGPETEKFEVLTTLANQLQSANTYPKVYIPGTVFYVYKTSRVLKSSASSPSFKRSPKRSQSFAPESGIEAVDDERPHYVLERTDRTRFLTVQVKLQAHDWLVEHHVEPEESPQPQRGGGLMQSIFGKGKKVVKANPTM
ncbi:hypothetical protein HDU97_003916 [Phlyctochytrium planicorne]|nr:hypothetical protein HDU97_003916 [Phlyctochytrium planicorne]